MWDAPKENTPGTLTFNEAALDRARKWEGGRVAPPGAGLPSMRPRSIERGNNSAFSNTPLKAAAFNEAALDRARK